jgi:GT2 family glycosyltransferase/SAM-dependent methyltransferase/Flp pilus assembly protein TadD
MAVGRPVISWEIPDRPKTNALFQNNHEIVLFPAHSPQDLVERIEYVFSDPKRADAIGASGQRKLLTYHTAERRMQQVLEWIESGKEPDYGIHPFSAEQQTGASAVGDILGDKGLMRGESMESDNFYVNLFVKAPHWSTPYPNADEAARWSKIAAFLEHILRRVRQQDTDKQLRMVDVGCGRGWLTNLATAYGTCEGIEPVAGVIEWARKLFPHLRFEAGTAENILRRPDFTPYDVVLTSEVIEHVPHGQKETFLAQLAQLLKPDGYLILTTPRGEMWEQWKTIAPPNQPVEDWVTEDQLRALFASQGFSELGLERVHVEVPNLRFVPAATPADLRSMNLLPIYQVWVCQRTAAPLPIAFTRTPKVSVIVPTYNRPDRLRMALESLAAQTFQDFEVIVVNDAGCEIGFVIAACADRHRITTITHDRNRGLAAARNSGLREAKGTYIAYLDDDDRYLPNHLETLVGYLDRHECCVAYTDAWRVHERQIDGMYVETGRDVPYSYDFSPADLLVSNYFPVLCVMHARQCLEEVGYFDESLFAHEDWDLWIRMATRFPFKHLPVTTAEFTWRSDGTSMTSGTRDTYKRTTELIYRKYAPYAELIAGVRDNQQRHLEKLYAQTSPTSFTCSIIIPTWNKVELTMQCLTALASNTGNASFEVIIVDNGSTDGTQEFLSTLSGDLQLILNKENLGFAKACNQGARVARGKYLVFLNNDTIPQPGWLSSLVSEVDAHPEVGVVGSKLLYPDGTVQHAGVVRDCQHLLPYHIYKSFAGSHPAVNQRREFQIVTAACLLIRRSLYEDVGGFDEKYVNGFEDVDLCLKVRERGHVVVYQPRSVVVHLESQTPGRKQNEDANAARFLDRWGMQWWAADEDLHFYIDGYKLKRILRNGKVGGDIVLLEDIKDRASWAHVAAVQTAALKEDWEAVKRELRLVEDWPNDEFVLSWGAMVAERLQESGSRTKFLSRYLALVDVPAERLALIRMLLEQKNLAGAEEHLRLLLASSPSDAEALFMQGILFMQREQYEQAERAFGSAMREGANRKKCLMGMGMAAMGRAYTQGAWERFLQVLAEYPDDGEAIHWLLRAGTAQNRWQELGEQLRTYVARNPGDLAIRFAFASVLLRSEQVEAARREYDEIRKFAPSYDGLDQLGQAITGREAVLAMEAASS